MKLQRDEDFEGTLPDNRLAFSIAPTAELLAVLSDGIYKDKIGAVIRELSCNAYDSHVASKQERKFIVQIPSRFEPTFVVEDFGTGIDPAKIADIFWTYGRSTKTDSNDQIGALGLGSKSPFAYTKTSFLVRNRFNGNEYTYMCFIDEKGFPAGSLLNQEATSEPNGVRIEIAVRGEDVQPFRDRINKFFSYWPESKRPEFIGQQPWFPSRTAELSGHGWALYDYVYSDVSRAIALMGNVPYKLDASAIPNITENLRFVLSRSFELEFNLGELSFQASREELSYNPHTIAALTKRADEIVASFAAEAKIAVEKGAKTPYILRRQYEAALNKYSALYTQGYKKIDRNTFFKKHYNFDTFQTEDGRQFTCEQLNRGLTLVEKTHLPFNVYERPAYSHKNSPQTVTKVTIAGKDAQGNDGQMNYPWFNLQTTGRKTVKGGLLTDYLLYMKPIETVIGLSVHSNQIIINDHGYHGMTAARSFFRNTSQVYYTIVDPDKSTTASAVFAKLKSMLEGTTFEGIEMIMLSALPGFSMPKKTVVHTAVPLVRGEVEVRTLKLNHRKQLVSTGYHRVNPNGYEAFYFLPNESTDYAEQIDSLLTLGLLSMNSVFIVRPQDTIDRMIKRGAKLTYFTDYIKQVSLDNESKVAFMKTQIADSPKYVPIGEVQTLLYAASYCSKETRALRAASSRFAELFDALSVKKPTITDAERARSDLFSKCVDKQELDLLMEEIATVDNPSKNIINAYPLIKSLFNTFNDYHHDLEELKFYVIGKDQQAAFIGPVHV